MKQCLVLVLLCVLSACLATATLFPQSAPTPTVSSKEKSLITREMKTSLKAGIDWLLSAQNEDGSWGPDKQMPGETGVTAWALLALMGEDGSTPDKGKHSKVIRRGLDWLLEQMDQRGTSIENHKSSETMYEVGYEINLCLIAVFLAELKGMENHGADGTVGTLMRKCCENIAEAQNQNGGWWDSDLTSATAWLALRCAHEAGTSVKKADADKVLAFVQKNFNSKSGTLSGSTYGYGTWFATTASCLRILYGHGKADSAMAKSATDLILSNKYLNNGAQFGGAGGGDYLALLLLTQALYDTKYRHEWFAYARDRLREMQNADGSWYGGHCYISRTFCTACSVLTLETPFKILPMIGR